MIEPITDRQRELLAGRVVVASVSGGKDSAAMSLWLTENGIEHKRVFADTGWEHALTYEYLRGPLTAKLGPIDEVVGKDGGMANLVVRKGMFPSRTRRFCTSELKVKPLAAYMKALGAPVASAVGIRAAESEARAKQPEWEPADDIYGTDTLVWRPLLRWTEQDVIDIHTRHGLPPNPLYLKGASRVGCWPCIFARKKELVFIADHDPERVKLIRELETRAQITAMERYAAAGETFESLGYNPPTFFQAAGALRSEGKDGRMVPIDEVIRWARTARGGKQFELFAPQQEEGCVRWGLCEAAPEEDAA